MESTQLKRQQYALQCIEAVEKKADYKSYIESFGLLVYNNGLINTIIYTEDKNVEIYNQVKNWINNDNYLLGFDANTNNENKDIFINNLTSCTMAELLEITQEVIRLADMLKLIAKAKLT